MLYNTICNWWLTNISSSSALYFIATGLLFRSIFNKNKNKKQIKSQTNVRRDSIEVIRSKTSHSVQNIPQKKTIVDDTPEPKVIILYATSTNTSKNIAEKLQTTLSLEGFKSVSVKNIKDYDPDTLEKEDVVLFVCSTWSEGLPPQTANTFFNWLQDLVEDFRVSKMHLGKTKFAVIGLGGKIYSDHFCTPVCDRCTSSTLYVCNMWIYCYRQRDYVNT
jgi:sulfite reductase alpha subunit-like flavoprotein